MDRPLLQVRIQAGYGRQSVLRDISFDVHAGEILGLVGTSGAGKSTLVLALLGLLKWRGGKVTGEILLEGQDLLRMRERDLRRLRGKTIALVPQSPMTALNSALSLRAHFEEAWKAHENSGRKALAPRLATLMSQMQLPADPEFLQSSTRRSQRRPGTAGFDCACLAASSGDFDRGRANQCIGPGEPERNCEVAAAAQQRDRDHDAVHIARSDFGAATVRPDGGAGCRRGRRVPGGGRDRALAASCDAGAAAVAAGAGKCAAGLAGCETVPDENETLSETELASVKARLRTQHIRFARLHIKEKRQRRGTATLPFLG